MKQTTHQSLRAVTLAILAFAMTSACTKSKELKNNVDPDAYMAVSSVQGKEFIAVTGIEEADSENTVDATPGMSHDFGLVRARVTEDRLEFYTTFDTMGREATASPILSYKITSLFNIKNETNDFGEKTNKVIEDKTVPWDQRAYMRVDWAHPTMSEASLLKMLVGYRHAKFTNAGATATDEDGNVIATEGDVTLVETPKIDEKGHISFLVESQISVPNSETYTFPYGIRAGHPYKVTYRTHFIPTNASDFKPVPYTLKDFGRFGYFFTQQDFANPKGVLSTNQKIYANVHNVCEAGRAGSCSTNKIRWVLSKGFPDKYKDVARRVVNEWNKTFQEALNRNDQIVYLDESSEAEISDLSQNILAYYPDRTKSGLLGVAQWVSNPKTGELVGVRATIYGDGIDYMTAQVDDMINLLSTNDPVKDVFGSDALGTPDSFNNPYDDKAVARQFMASRQTLGFDKVNRSPIANASPLMILNTAARSMEGETGAKSNVRMVQLANQSPELFRIKEHDILGDAATYKDSSFPKEISGMPMPKLGGLQDSLFVQARFAEDRDRMLHMQDEGVHGTELVEEAAIRYLMNYLKAGNTVADLSKNRQMIEDKIAQETFYTTALHEMGHAFGLRHNFKGSADDQHYAKEYYQIKQALAQGSKQYVKEDLDPFASSSIMDYGRDFYSQKAGLGPYDKAAIKYAYNRSIDRDSDPVTLAKFKFCTDHMVDEDVLCRRFDKGANVSEVTKANIDFYNHSFVRMHYRRDRLSEGLAQGWGNPRALVGSLISRVFIPTRQVMDEFLYSLISSPRTADGDGLCAMPFVKDSVDNGEIADICSNTAMEDAHVDPTNMATLVNALFQFDDQGNMVGVYKPSAEYKAYGFADLLWANMQAQSFFASVIGSPEPGTYIAMPVKDQSGRQSFQLKELDASKTTVDEKLKAFAQENGIEASPDFLKQASNLVTEVKVGGMGRQLESRTSIEGGFTRTESLGAWWDKYAAIIALSIDDLPVRKYGNAKMSGNPYFFPQTKPFATSMFSHLITGDSAISSIRVQLAAKDENGDPVVVSAAAPAALNSDLQAISSFYAAAALVSETERSMVGKLQICDANQGECSNDVAGNPVAQFRSSQGGNLYKAVQNSTGDSIAYKLVSQAQAIDTQRAKWIKMRDDADAAQADNLMKLDASGELRDKIVAGLTADAELAALVVGQDANGQPVHLTDVLTGAWSNLSMLTKVIKQNGTRFTAIAIAQQTAGQFQQLAATVDQRLAKLGDAGECWVKLNPVATAAVELAPKIQTEITLAARLDALLVAQNAVGPVAAAQPGAAPAQPAQPGPLCADEAAGKVRQNLLVLKANFVQANALVKTVIQADVNAIAAPLQINALNNQIASKETQIERIRKLVYRISH